MQCPGDYHRVQSLLEWKGNNENIMLHLQWTLRSCIRNSRWHLINAAYNVCEKQIAGLFYLGFAVRMISGRQFLIPLPFITVYLIICHFSSNKPHFQKCKNNSLLAEICILIPKSINLFNSEIIHKQNFAGFDHSDQSISLQKEDFISDGFFPNPHLFNF